MTNHSAFDEGPPTTAALKTIPRRLPVVMFTLATFAYLVAVTQRSSLGVAGLDAAERFSANATALSSLGMMQMVIYAAMQIPVGMLLDRLGASRMIVTGAALMAVGQAIVAIAPTLELAVIGRVLVGAGDATTFVSGLRLVNAWFPPRRVPFMQQWFGNLGQIGQFLSAVPFAALLHMTSWTTAFLSVAAMSVIVVVVALAALHDTPVRRSAGIAVSTRGAFIKLADALARPGTRLGFWSHFTSQFPATVFGLLWGFPIMVQGLGFSRELATMLLMVPAIAGMVFGPLLGIATARWPLRRSNLVIGIAVVQTACWVLCIIWPGTPPIALFILTIVISGIGGTGATIGFDFARTFNPSSSLGSASGIVNVGGFASSAIAMLMIGIAVDAVSHDSGVTWGSFQFALWTFPIVTALGMAALLRERHRTRSRLAAEEGVVVAPLWIAIVRRWRRDHQG